MTDTATAAETEVGGLTHSWWARALNLRERLAAPGAPLPPRTDAPHDRPASWSLGDPEGFAARLASLGSTEDAGYALAREEARRLAARAEKPDWAAYAERIVAAAPERWTAPGGEGAEGAGGAAVFLPVLRPLIDTAWAEAAALIDLPETELAALRAAFEAWLGDRLIHQCARTLVRELHAARTAGTLPGRTSRERFDDFLSRTGTREGLVRLFTGYPVLARMLAQSCRYAAAAAAELARRYSADRAAVVRGLLDGRDPGPLVRIDLGRGDVHQGNRAVALLRFADGSTVVHKPRPLDQHALLDQAVGWTNAKVPGLGLRTPRSVRRPGYGWLEFIAHGWCASVTELDRFYRRQGALLALLYAVDGVDMHYENVIACGDQPVLVDAETLLHSGLPAAVTCGTDPAAAALSASVHRTCLLPSLLIGENGAMDISALGGGHGGSYPSDGMRWEAAGTDEMRVLRGRVETPAGQNRPAPGDPAAGHGDHRAALLEGFRAGYDAIVEHRDELLGEDGLLARWATSPGRLIARATRLYTTLLEESTHPDVLRDALTRDALFAVLWAESENDPARRRLIEDETADLWAGDVPLFYHHPAHTSVRSSRGALIEGVLPAPSLRTALDKIAAMDEVDRHDQEWIISATLAVTGANLTAGGPRSALAGHPAPAVVPEPSRLLTAACGIADEIAARAVHGEDRVNWLGLEQVAGEHWAVLPMGGGLAQGYCGVALFLAQLGALTGAGRYTALARRAARPLPELLATLAANPALSAAVGPGALHGLSGIVYAVARLAALLDPPGNDLDRAPGAGSEGPRAGSEGLRACLPDALTALALAVEADPDGPDDLADGLAGALAATVAVHRLTGMPGAAALSHAFADRLRARSGTRPSAPADPGFAHGDAGIGWALLRYAAEAGRAGADGAGAARAAECARTGAALLRPALDTALGRPADLGWHSGLAGTALAAADALGRAGQPVPGAELTWCAALLGDPAESGGPVGPAGSGDLSLGHGTLGSLELLSVLAGQGHTGAATALTHRAGQVLGGLECHGHRCGTPDHVPSPGLLTGLSGIGYALLRLGFPEAVPSVLLLH
ncbi:type 2 lanthipeptide synthetase LanM family protein [Streptomyces sp. G-G2]|uniref:type 2 lanthipeptide synthetase LanM family protein n=1 Tax=Streptomyces sp. G-G2 TaxID=3046201 RepID=UPI0024B999E4|nr:type 2 lanthipeptide synthetase LanM family protein [Streptomyces sp. G-G2]MDJ0383651.1 type 2 lanthipeptide synthetase LanM family protein [Streptomyces sp. G-G2]